MDSRQGLRCRFGRIYTALTRQERSLLLRVADGQSDAEIASDLGYTLKTIKNYNATIYRKLGAHSRITAVNMAVLFGEIPCPHCARRHVFAAGGQPRLLRKKAARHVQRMSH